MATECTFQCGTIGEPLSNAELKAALKDKYCQTGSAFCEQLAEILGCAVSTSTRCYVNIGPFGPRGPVVQRTNPIDPNLKCPKKGKARKLVGVCAPVTG